MEGLEPLFSLQALRWRVGNAEARLDLRIAPGEILHLAGPSGSGKTTLLRVLARLHPRLGGEMRLEDVPAGRIAAHLWRRQVLYVAQNPVLFPGSAAENLAAPFRLPSRRKEAAPGDGLLSALAGRLGLGPALLAREGGLLSGGEGARVCLARALLVGPRLLLADEPFAFLDPEATLLVAETLASWVAAPGRALVLVSHAELPAPLARARTLDAGTLLREAAQ